MEVRGLAARRLGDRRFFDTNEAWLKRVLEQGQAEGTLEFTGSTDEAALMIVSGLEGAMLVARSYGDVARFHAAASRLLAGLASRDVAAAQKPA
jgi:TetR/AcrR family transcriptional regulator, transcriptional repressor for nem operon